MKRQPQDFTVGMRFAILDRAYKPTEVFLVLTVYDHAIVCHPAGEVEGTRRVAPEHWSRLTIPATALAGYDIELRPLLVIDPATVQMLRRAIAQTEDWIARLDSGNPIPYDAGESPYAN